MNRSPIRASDGAVGDSVFSPIRGPWRPSFSGGPSVEASSSSNALPRVRDSIIGQLLDARGISSVHGVPVGAGESKNRVSPTGSHLLLLVLLLFLLLVPTSPTHTRLLARSPSGSLVFSPVGVSRVEDAVGIRGY